MYVCICKAVTDTDIRSLVTETMAKEKAACSPAYICESLGVADTCGQCVVVAEQVIASAVEQHAISLNR